MVYFNFNRIKTKKTLIGFGLGQILSLLSTSLSFTSSEIARKDFSFFFFSNHPIFKHSHELTKFEIFIGINAPTSQSFLGYVLLAIVYGGIMLYRRSAIKWYHYLLLAFVDVEANFLVVKAYQNTSMTSVMLLDCWAIPCVLVFTWVFLKTKYRLMKISGVVICNVGVVMVVFSDVHAGDRAGGSNPIKGDFLVIAGATLYAVSNVSQEFLVKNADRVQLMSLLGLFGAIIGAIQISIFMKTKKTLIGLGLGQIISLLSTLIASIASEIARKGISAPTSQTFLGYVSLAIVYGGIMLYRRSAIKVKWYHYFLLAVVDVEANFLVVKAFQNTSMTSIMLLDCWAIPCVLVLTWVFLKTRYRLMKISGVVICIVGVVMVVFSDVHAGDRAGGSNPVKGDFLVIAGATLYAVSNVTEEFLVKNADVTELMAFLGLFGAIIAAIQISIFERGAVRAIQWSTEAILLYIGGALGLFLFYTLITILIKNNGSTMFNLSLLTSDMWAILIRTFGYHEKVDWLYFLAFATTATGLIIYSMKEKDEEEQRSGEVVSERRKLFDEEDGDSLHSNLIDAST